MTVELPDLHALEPEAFREEVRSFEFWFQAVEGYLRETEFGLRPGTAEAAFTREERERLVTVLCNYCAGETAALEAAGGLIRVAPNRACKVFLSTQTADEGRHLEVLSHRLRELGVEDPGNEVQRRASPSLLTFKGRLLELVADGNWPASIFAQNVILEAVEFSVFQEHQKTADERTRELLEGIVKDERRHLGFGENELGRSLGKDPLLRRRLVRIRAELDPLVLGSFREVHERIGTPAQDRLELGRQYLQVVERLGFV